MDTTTRLLARLFLVSALTTGCGADDAPIRVSIGPSGGDVQGDGVALALPAGAVISTLEIGVEEIPVPAGFEGRAFRFTPEGTTFEVPVVVTFDGATDSSQGIYWSRPDGASGFDRLETSFEAGTARAEVTHFSTGFLGSVVSSADAGTLDGGSGDGAIDVVSVDATVAGDAGPSDAGVADVPIDAGPSGIDCVTTRATDLPACTMFEMTTQNNVEFFHVYGESNDSCFISSDHPGLTEISGGFAPFINHEEGNSYVLTTGGGGGLFTWSGGAFEAAVDVSRTTGCDSGDAVHVVCTGSTTLGDRSEGVCPR